MKNEAWLKIENKKDKKKIIMQIKMRVRRRMKVKERIS